MQGSSDTYRRRERKERDLKKVALNEAVTRARGARVILAPVHSATLSLTDTHIRARGIHPRQKSPSGGASQQDTRRHEARITCEHVGQVYKSKDCAARAYERV